MKRLLILSFSPIAADARVLKQVRLAAATDFHVTTCGFGPAPAEADRHIELAHASLPGKTWDALLQLRAYRAGYWWQPDVRAARVALRGHQFDLIVANDIDTLPLALSLRPQTPVHADLHEYFPRLHDEHPPWARRIGPWYRWLCARHLPRAAAVTTVAPVIAKEYSRQFGVDVDVVTNATPYRELTPGPVDQPIRLVHSGTSHRQRNIRAIVDAVVQTPGVTLDLYLTGNDPAHLAELRSIAATEPRITVREPVPYDQLIATLNSYDVGVHLLPPINFNFANALPNKVFDYVQARLGLIVGPSPEMTRVIRGRNLGHVTGGFTAGDLTTALADLTPARVQSWKQVAHAAAHDLSAESQLPIWGAIWNSILGQANR